MENIFKHNLRIRKNTPQLRKKLEELGYWQCPIGYDEWHIPIDHCENLITDRRGFYMGEKVINPNDSRIDCRHDELRFLEMAKMKI